VDYIFPVTMGFTVLILIGLGVLVKHYKAYWLISGYNTMSKEKKKNVDIEGLAKFTGNMCFAIGIVMILGTAAISLSQEILGTIIFTAFFPLTVYMIIKAQKYDGNNFNPDGTMKRKSKILIWGICTFLLLTTVGVSVMLYYSYQPTDFVIENNVLHIKGLYGEEIPLSDISELSLRYDLPEITSRTNGFSLGSVKKGHFRLKSLGKAKLFLDASQPPFIYLMRNGQPVIFNCWEKEETENLFRKLK
jgi:hypothetical protein